MTDRGEVDWSSFDLHINRTVAAGLIPAINMDTGYANLISEEIRRQAIERTCALTKTSPLEHRFISGVFVNDQSNAPFCLEQYKRGIDPITAFNGTPILFQSYGLAHQVGRSRLRKLRKTSGSLLGVLLL